MRDRLILYTHILLAFASNIALFLAVKLLNNRSCRRFIKRTHILYKTKKDEVCSVISARGIWCYALTLVVDGLVTGTEAMSTIARQYGIMNMMWYVLQGSDICAWAKISRRMYRSRILISQAGSPHQQS